MLTRRRLLAALCAAPLVGRLFRRKPVEPFLFCTPPSETHWTKSRVRVNGYDAERVPGGARIGWTPADLEHFRDGHVWSWFQADCPQCIADGNPLRSEHRLHASHKPRGERA